MLGNRLHHRLGVQGKVCGQRHAHKVQPLQSRAHGVHHKTRQRGEDHGLLARYCIHRHIARHGQERNQLVRTIAQHDVKAFGHIRMHRQRMAQIVNPPIRVTVQRQRT